MTAVEPMTCGARNRHGEPCALPAGWGTESRFGRCRFHGGASPNGKVHAARLEAFADVRVLGDLPVTDPAGALQLALDLAHARLLRLARLDTDDPAALAAEGAAVDRLVRAAKVAADTDLRERTHALAQRLAATIGRAFDAALASEGISDVRRRVLVAAFSRELTVLEARDVTAPALR